MGKDSKTQADMESIASAMPAAMMAASPVSAKAWADVMTECSRFVMKRLQQDLETQQAMLACKNPTDLIELQSDFYQQATRQYAEQATRLLDMISKSTQKTIAETGVGHSRKYDDIPL